MIATTIEQSKRLLAAGISPETADMIWAQHSDFSKPFLTVKPHTTIRRMIGGHSLPAWSLSALWDLCKEKGFQLEFCTKEDSSERMIEHMVSILADPIISIMDKVVNGEI